MTRIDIVSGFLGAGKTTLIKKLLKEALKDTRVVLIENEFGEIGIDGGFLKEAGIEIKEMNSGCICCSLVGDFGTALREVIETYQPERVLIEPSGVGKLSDVLQAVRSVALEMGAEIGKATVVVDAEKCKRYMKNFGEFFKDQIRYGDTIILSRTDKAPAAKVEEALALIREHNKEASVVTTPIAGLEAGVLLAAMDGGKSRNRLQEELIEQVREEHDRYDHDHHEHGHGEGCSCGHHGHEDHDHHGHSHGEGCGCGHHGHHEHEHSHGEGCGCGHHGHHDHDHHQAEDVFTSWGLESGRAYTQERITALLEELETGSYGEVLRAKGMVPSPEGMWVYFDYVPGEMEVRRGAPDITGRICVIGAGIDEKGLETLFGEA